MARLLFTLSCLLGFHFQVNTQIIRPPLNFLSRRPYTDAIVELPRNVIDVPRNYIDIPRNYIDIPRNYIDIPRNYIDIPRNYIDIPRNYIDIPRNFIDVPRNVPQPIIAEPPIIPINNVPNPATTVITDCTPSVCKNLADTINIMIVSNLLQNTLGDLKNLKMAAPLLKNIMSNPGLARYPGLISNLATPNLVAPNFVAPNSVAPNSVAPNSIVPINESAMLSNLLKMLGNTV